MDARAGLINIDFLILINLHFDELGQGGILSLYDISLYFLYMIRNEAYRSYQYTVVLYEHI